MDREEPRPPRARIGILLCGHREYWPQFPGMKDELLKNGEHFRRLVERSPADVTECVFVDALEDALAAGLRFREQHVDLLFVYLTTYVASGRFVQGALAADCPVVLVGLQRPVDLKGGLLLEAMTGAGSPCQMPEAWNAFMRCGRPALDLVFGELYDDPRVADRIDGWCRAAAAVRALKGSVFGFLGHPYEGMLDMNVDATAITRRFGVHVRFVEMCELVEYVQACPQAELQDKVDDIRAAFDIADAGTDPTTRALLDGDLEFSARCAVGLDRLMDRNHLSGLAYYYMGEDDSLYERVASNLAVGNSLLTSRGRSLAGEADLKTCLAMFITSAIGCGGSFTELCSVDFTDDIVLIGHDGPHDLRITQSRPRIRGLGIMHGKKGHGVSVEFSIRNGPVTLVGLGNDAMGDFRFVVAEGESREGWIPPIGNTLTRGYFGKDAASFVEEWSMSGACHHMSLCVGHNGGTIDKVGRMLGIPVIHIR